MPQLQTDATNQQKNHTVSATLDRYCLQRPSHEGILRVFQPILEKRAELEERFAKEPLDTSSLDTSRLDPGNNGVPILSSVSLDFLDSWLQDAAKEILQVLEEALPENESLKKCADAIREERFSLTASCELLLSRDNASLEKISNEADVEFATLHFVLQQIAGAPLAALAQRVGEIKVEYAWKQGFCPVCGSFPSIAYLARQEPTDLDSLVGGGGQKYLHCSQCGNEWRYRRDACPACENADPGTREMLHAHKARQERVELCTKCHSYFPCIDLREYADDPDMLAAPLGLMHLDIIAAEKGYAPLAPAPWNTFPKEEGDS